MNALFNDSIFFDSETILLKEMFISHSKNVVTPRKEKADESALTRMNTICIEWKIVSLNCPAKI